jgi:site-specific DNA-cytosine methylase
MGTLDTDGASTTAIGAQTRGVIVAFGRSSFGGWDGQEVTSPVCSRDAKDASSIIVDQTLANGEDVTATLTLAYADKQGLEDQHVNSGCPLFVISSGQANASISTGLAPTLDTTGEVPIACTAKPRRLTPLECERLMSWPDQWTAAGMKDDGTRYELSDTARYRLCGNGVGSVCAEWSARRLYEAIQGTVTV